VAEIRFSPPTCGFCATIADVSACTDARTARATFPCDIRHEKQSRFRLTHGCRSRPADGASRVPPSRTGSKVRRPSNCAFFGSTTRSPRRALRYPALPMSVFLACAESVRHAAAADFVSNRPPPPLVCPQPIAALGFPETFPRNHEAFVVQRAPDYEIVRPLGEPSRRKRKSLRMEV
jgi:hypothetical protein